MDDESEIKELGDVTTETKGAIEGACIEQSVLPRRLLLPTGGCPKP